MGKAFITKITMDDHGYKRYSIVYSDGELEHNILLVDAQGRLRLKKCGEKKSYDSFPYTETKIKKVFEELNGKKPSAQLDTIESWIDIGGTNKFKTYGNTLKMIDLGFLEEFAKTICKYNCSKLYATNKSNKQLVDRLVLMYEKLIIPFENCQPIPSAIQIGSSSFLLDTKVSSLKETNSAWNLLETLCLGEKSKDVSISVLSIMLIILKAVSDQKEKKIIVTEYRIQLLMRVIEEIEGIDLNKDGTAPLKKTKPPPSVLPGEKGSKVRIVVKVGDAAVGSTGIIAYGPDSDGDYKITFDHDGSKSKYVKRSAFKLKIAASIQTTEKLITVNCTNCNSVPNNCIQHYNGHYLCDKCGFATCCSCSAETYNFSLNCYECNRSVVYKKSATEIKKDLQLALASKKWFYYKEDPRRGRIKHEVPYSSTYPKGNFIREFFRHSEPNLKSLIIEGVSYIQPNCIYYFRQGNNSAIEDKDIKGDKYDPACSLILDSMHAMNSFCIFSGNYSELKEKYLDKLGALQRKMPHQCGLPTLTPKMLAAITSHLAERRGYDITVESNKKKKKK